jgi:hypothetical protein
MVHSCLFKTAYVERHEVDIVIGLEVTVQFARTTLYSALGKEPMNALTVMVLGIIFT